MNNQERKEKEKTLDYYYGLKHRVDGHDLIELNKMIENLEKELRND